MPRRTVLATTTPTTTLSKAGTMSVSLRKNVPLRMKFREARTAPTSSVGPTLLVSAVGAALGAGVAKMLDKSAGAGASAGLVAGLVGSGFMPSAQAEEVVDISRRTPDEAEIDTILIPPLGGRGATMMPVFTTGELNEPPGWLGAIIQHGILTQLEQMKYVKKHAKYEHPGQIMPHLGVNNARCVSWKEVEFCNTSPWGNCYESVCYGPPKDDETNFSDSTLFTERYIEWPSPAWSTFRMKPTFFNPSTWAGKSLHQAAVEFCHRHGGKRRSKYQGFNLSKVVSQVAAYPDTLKVPPVWQSNVPLFTKRLEQYYGIGQWLVWAGEMFRIHSRSVVRPNDPSAIYYWNAWKDHCLAWGVGYSEAMRVVKKRNMLDLVEGGTLIPDGRLWLRTGFNHSQVREYLELIMKHTPPPGTPGFNGAQIAPDGFTRMLCDMPEAVGSMKPPWEIDQREWLEGMRTIIGNQGANKGLAVFVKVLGVVNSLMPGGSAVINTVTGYITSVVTEVIMAGGYLRVGEAIGWNDIVGMVGDLMTAASDELGLDLAGVASEGIDAFEEVARELQMSSVYGQIMSTYSDLKEIYGWDYVDQAFGTLLAQTAAEDREGLLG